MYIMESNQWIELLFQSNSNVKVIYMRLPMIYEYAVN
jgi:hypothetical protein